MDDGAPLYSIYRLLMHSSICILEEFNLFYLFIYFILLYLLLNVSIINSSQ